MSHLPLASSSSPAAPRPLEASARADLRPAAPARPGAGGASAFARVLSDVQQAPLTSPEALPTGTETVATVKVNDVAPPGSAAAPTDERDGGAPMALQLPVDPVIAAPVPAPWLMVAPQAVGLAHQAPESPLVPVPVAARALVPAVASAYVPVEAAGSAVTPASSDVDLGSGATQAETPPAPSMTGADAVRPAPPERVVATEPRPVAAAVADADPVAADVVARWRVASGGLTATLAAGTPRTDRATRALNPAPTAVPADHALGRLVRLATQQAHAERKVAAAVAAALPAGEFAVPSQATGTPGSHSAQMAFLRSVLATGASTQGAPRDSGTSYWSGPTPIPTPIVSHPLAEPVASAAAPPAMVEHVLDQLVTSIRMQWKEGLGEAKLQLRPDALGSVTVALRVEAGAVTAVVRAESPDVQEWVLQNQQVLRQQLEAAGLRLDSLTVNPDEQRQAAPDEAPPDQRRRRALRAQGGEPTPRFELTA